MKLSDTLLNRLFTSITFIFILIVCFYNLDYYSIRIFDEGRIAVNAIEMYLNKHFLYTTYLDELDTWNTKPPFLIWLQVGLMNLIGPGEWALRLPIAISGVGIALLLSIFTEKIFKLPSWEVKVVSLICLFSLVGFTTTHTLRTGDYDILLIFFQLSYILSYYLYLQTFSRKYIIYFYIAISFAILTKGVAALFFLPGLFIYTIIEKKLKKIILSPSVWIYMLIPIVFAGGYYLIRESVTPGYLKSVWINELFGRYTKDTDNTEQQSIYYYFNFLTGTFFGLVPLSLAILSIPLSLYLKVLRKEVLFISILALTFLLIISSSATKLYWYVAPTYPLLSLLAGISLFLLYRICSRYTSSLVFKSLFFVIAILIFFGKNIKTVLKDRFQPVEFEMAFSKMAYDFKPLIKKGIKLEGEHIILDYIHYSPHYVFYSKILGKDSKLQNPNQVNLSSGKRLVTNSPFLKNYIEEYLPIQNTKNLESFKVYDIAAINSGNDKRLAELKLDTLNNLNNNVTVIPISKKLNRYAFVQKVTNTPSKNYYLHFRVINNFSNTEYNEVVNIEKDGWDHINYTGYNVKFIQLEYTPYYVKYGYYSTPQYDKWETKIDL